MRVNLGDANILVFDGVRNVHGGAFLIPDIMIFPAYRRAFFIELGLKAANAGRTIRALLHILLAAPHHLDRIIDLRGNQHGALNIIHQHTAAPAETAAQHKRVHGHIVSRYAQNFGGMGAVCAAQTLNRGDGSIGGGINRIRT